MIKLPGILVKSVSASSCFIVWSKGRGIWIAFPLSAENRELYGTFVPTAPSLITVWKTLTFEININSIGVKTAISFGTIPGSILFSFDLGGILFLL